MKRTVPIRSVNKQTNRQDAWSAMVEVYNEFSSETSIHGLKYTTQRKSRIDRFIWLVIVGISILCAALLASRFYERQKNAAMRTTVVSNQFPAWKIGLPAVTLCHGSMVTKVKLLALLSARHKIYIPRGLTPEEFQKALPYLREVYQPTNRFPDELNSLHEVLAANKLSILEFLKQLSPNCSEYLIKCRFEGQIKPCESLVAPSITPYGLCCSFNYNYARKLEETSISINANSISFRLLLPAIIPVQSKNPATEYHSVRFGAQFVLSFLISPNFNDRLASTIYGDGIKVLIHERFSYPGPEALEFVAADGHETIASVFSSRLISSPEAIGLGTDIRDCIKADSEVAPYRTETCYVKCRERVTLKLCGCVPFYTSSLMRSEEVCNLTKVDCLARTTSLVGSLRLSDSLCDCLPECEGDTFAVTTTSIPLNAAKHCPGEFYKAAVQQKNATALHITLGGQSAVLQRRDVIQSWINLLSSLGGVFSLFLGCSFISVIEVLYFVCLRLPQKLRTNKEQQSIHTN